jgi:hypothetical protein
MNTLTDDRGHLLNSRTLARRLGLSRGALEAEAGAGRLPHVRIGKAFLFDLVEVERVLLERARQAPPAGPA